jgi:hypothetical protein
MVDKSNSEKLKIFKISSQNGLIECPEHFEWNINNCNISSMEYSAIIEDWCFWGG